MCCYYICKENNVENIKSSNEQKYLARERERESVGDRSS